MKKAKKPYCFHYQVKDRFGHKVRTKATFDTWEKAQGYAAKVLKVEKKTKGTSAKLLSWGSNS